MIKKNKKAVVLSSGGLDSTTLAAIVQSDGYEIYGLSFNYGQRHFFELNAAKKIARTMNFKKHLIMNMELNKIGGSALTDKISVPKLRDKREFLKEIPVTYVPARNTIFLSYALAWAEVINAFDIFIGVNSVDFSGYPDCRPEYISAYEHMANLATKSCTEDGFKLKIRTPLLFMSKAEIIKKGLELNVDYSITHSCYDPDKNGIACGMCDSCMLRKKGFKEVGIKDPVSYQNPLG